MGSSAHCPGARKRVCLWALLKNKNQVHGRGHSSCLCLHIHISLLRRSPSHMDTQCQLIETYVSPASHVQTQDAIVGESGDIWYLNGIPVGSYVPTSTLSKIPRLSNIESAIINPRKLRQLSSGMKDVHGCDFSGFYAVSDIGAVWLFHNPKSAFTWARRIDRSTAPSITTIDAGQEKVSTPLFICEYIYTPCLIRVREKY